MNEPQRTEEPRPELGGDSVEENSRAADTQLPSERDAAVSIPGEPQASKRMTAEEQMALYEKELKENDWGHQPC